MIQKQNVTIEDINRIAEVIDISLTDEQTLNILNEYNREVLDRSEDWMELVNILIVKEGIKQFLKELNKQYMEKRITITIEDKNGDNKQYSTFSNNKIEHITNTNQWEYVINTIIESFDKGFETKGDYMFNPEIKE